MNLQTLKTRFPQIEPESLYSFFPRISPADYSELKEYTWEDCHRGFMGAGGLFLVVDTARRMKLGAGLRVLDLCCGSCASSIFLAKQYGVHVTAVDLNADPFENMQRIKDAGLSDRVTPLKMDARDLRLPEESFDAVFCMNSYFYFGTEDAYLPTLVRVLRKGGCIGIAGPCYADELKPDTPPEFLYDAPDFIESRTVHSPPWWRAHFEKAGVVRLQVCEEHPKGREFWLDDVRWLLESCPPRQMSPGMSAMVLQQMVMLLSDQERFVTYLTLIAERGCAETNQQTMN